MIENAPPTRHQIMAVDDQPENLKLLEDMLRQRGYMVRSFPRGRLALAAASQHPPDLILLDVNMPEMNGYEVCERLKGDEKLAGIPVIFLSALNEIEDKVRAFRSGGVDYISKPFQVDEVQARVETHTRLHRLHRALQVEKDRLEDHSSFALSARGNSASTVGSTPRGATVGMSANRARSRDSSTAGRVVMPSTVAVSAMDGTLPTHSAPVTRLVK